MVREAMNGNTDTGLFISSSISFSEYVFKILQKAVTQSANNGKRIDYHLGYLDLGWSSFLWPILSANLAYFAAGCFKFFGIEWHDGRRDRTAQGVDKHSYAYLSHDAMATRTWFQDKDALRFVERIKFMCIYRMVISWVVPVYLKIWYIQDIVCSVYSRLRSYIISLQYSWLPHCGTKFQWNANKPIWTLFKHLWTRHKGPLAQLPLYIAWSWSIDGTRYHPNSLDWNCQWICRTAFLLTSAGQH